MPEKYELLPDTFKKIDFSLGSDDKHVIGWIALTLTGHTGKGDYGLHLYRNDQLIDNFNKELITAHPNYGRIIGHLHLDFVDVNYNKIGFRKKGPVWRALIIKMQEEVSEYKRASIESYTNKDKKTGKVRTPQEKLEKTYLALGKQTPKELQTDTKQSEAVKEKLEASGNIITDMIAPITRSIEFALGKTLTIYGKDIRFQIKNKSDPNHPWRWRFHSYEASTGVLTVFINTESYIYQSIVYRDEKSGNYALWEYNINKAKEAIRRIALIESLVQLEERNNGLTWENKWSEADQIVNTLLIEIEDEPIKEKK